MTTTTAEQARELTLEEAAKRDNYCPRCRMVSFNPKPVVAFCACGDEAWEDCCADQECSSCKMPFQVPASEPQADTSLDDVMHPDGTMRSCFAPTDSEDDASEPQAAPPDTIWMRREVLASAELREHFKQLNDDDISYTRTSTAALKPHDVFLLMDEFEDAQETDYHIGKKRQLAEFIAARWEGKGN